MYILGIQGNFGRPEHDPDAVLIHDNDLVAAVEEERLIRYKCALGVMPDRAIKYCLKTAGITMKDVDVLAFPRNTWTGHENRLNWYSEYNFGSRPKRIEFVGHHLAHAASTYYYSGYEKSLILTIDMTGDGISSAVFRANGNDIQLVHEIPFPNSLGIFMALITQYLGFRSSQDEGKVMGLAAHGTPSIDMSPLLKVTNDGYRFNPKSLHSEVFKRYPEFHMRQLPFFSRMVEKVLPKRRLTNEEILTEHKDIAASAQKVVEDAVFKIIELFKKKSDEHLCLAGGVTQNSVLNGKIVSSGLFKEIFVTPVAGDAGSALGAATLVQAQSGFKPNAMKSCYLGPDYSSEYIKGYLKRNRIKYKQYPDIVDKVASDLAEEKIVALFQGRMEFGPRALGNRSLLANPKVKGMKYKVNIIKNREQFRPFAPSILHEYGPKLFRHYQNAPFMSFTFNTRIMGMRCLKKRHTLIKPQEFKACVLAVEDIEISLRPFIKKRVYLEL